MEADTGIHTQINKTLTETRKLLLAFGAASRTPLLRSLQKSSLPGLRPAVSESAGPPSTHGHPGDLRGMVSGPLIRTQARPLPGQCTQREMHHRAPSFKCTKGSQGRMQESLLCCDDFIAKAGKYYLQALSQTPN